MCSTKQRDWDRLYLIIVKFNIKKHKSRDYLFCFSYYFLRLFIPHPLFLLQNSFRLCCVFRQGTKVHRTGSLLRTDCRDRPDPRSAATQPWWHRVRININMYDQSIVMLLVWGSYNCWSILCTVDYYFHSLTLILHSSWNNYMDML